jgi:hypothetical protein
VILSAIHHRQDLLDSTGLLEFLTLSGVLKTQHFGNWMFPSLGVGLGGFFVMDQWKHPASETVQKSEILSVIHH